MKKIYELTATNKEPARVIEFIKNDIRKYIKREKRKDLPEGSDFWKIHCKIGQDVNSVEEIRFEDIMHNISALAQKDWDSCYIELESQTATMSVEKKIEVIEEQKDNKTKISEENIQIEDTK